MMALVLFLLMQQPPALSVVGNVEATGTVKAAGFVLPDGSVLNTVDWAKTRVLTYLAGCDVCGVLSQFSDQKTIYQNMYGVPMRILEVRCYSDADTAQVNLRRDDGSPAYILSAALSCTTAGAAQTVFAADAQVRFAPAITPARQAPASINPQGISQLPPTVDWRKAITMLELLQSQKAVTPGAGFRRTTQGRPKK